VFDLFAQAERTPDRSQGGLGLGLALVKSLVELHGGTVACYSGGLGQGSKFVVTLPRLKQESTPAARPGNQPELPAARNKLNILVVDDNVDAAQMLKMLLEASGHSVRVEHEARGALERAGQEALDVGILDIGLPDLDGNELARRLRKCSETANTTLIAVTGYGQEHDRNSSLTAGFNHHLVKPVDAASLLALLNQISNR
jgi:CheY-like chemotaxis protein